VSNWNIGERVPEAHNLEMRQTCIDYAPFLYKHKDTAGALQARQNQAAVRDLRASV